MPTITLAYWTCFFNLHPLHNAPNLNRKVNFVVPNLKGWFLDSTIFTYNCCAQLAYVMTSCHTMLRKLIPWHPYDMVDVIRENCARVDGRKSWHMLVPHDSHRQKSHCLTRHLEFPQKNATSLQCRRFLWAHECFCLRKSHVLTERVPSLWADFLAWHSHFFAEVLFKFLQPSLAAVALASPF